MKKIFIFTCLIVLIISTGLHAATAYPFPQNATYPYGIKVTSGITATNIQQSYNDWKNRYVTSGGCTNCLKVVSPEPVPGYGSNYTVSEGIAYGMLMAVWMGDQTTFDGLYRFKQNKAASKSPSKLMPWVIDASNNVVDTGSATDADIDIAFALLMADKQWGSGGALNYMTLATAEINDIRNYDVALDNHLKPGDAWDNHTFPSYFIVAFLREFKEIDTAHAAQWDTIVNKCLTMMNTAANGTTGLIGEIIETSGAAINDTRNNVDGRRYDYNSCRVPWRYAMDYCWNGNATAGTQTYVNKLGAFFNGKGATGVYDGYWVSSGTAYGPNRNAAFTGPAGCALMANTSYQTMLNNFGAAVSGFNTTESYYNGAIKVLTMLFMSGNMPNLRDIGPPQPTPTATTPPTGQLLDDFEDYSPYYNTQNNWGGYWYTYKAGGTAAITFPSGNHVTMTAGGPTGSTYYARLQGTIGGGTDYPCVGIGTELAEDATTLGITVDVSGFTGIRFWVKGNGTNAYCLRLMPISTINTGYNDFKYTFIPPATWTQVAIPFTDFTQETGWGTVVAKNTVLASLQKLNFQTQNLLNVTVDFCIDNVEFYPNMWTPTYTPSPLPTSTFTATLMPTSTPTFGTSTLLDDCEDGNGVNNWGGPWYTYDDSPNTGTSTIVPVPGGTFNMAAGGAATTAYAVRVTGVVTTAYAFGYIGVGTGTSALSPTDGAVNCTSFLGIRFYTKGDGAQYAIKLIPKSTVNTGNDNYKTQFIAPAAWTQHQLFFSSFTQEGWGTAATLTQVLTNLKAIEFQTIGQPWASVELWLDQLQMFPQANWTNTPTKTFTATNTHTRTNTPTASNTGTNTNTFTHTYTSTPVPPTNTFTNTSTSTYTRTFTNTATETPTRTFTNTATDTNTPLPPTNTYTHTNTRTNTNTATHTSTRTFTNTPTDTYTASNTPTNTNTATSTPTPVPGVDLVIVAQAITMYPVPGCVSGTMPPLGVLVTVRNSGTDPAGAFVVDVDGNTRGVASLASGASQDVFFSGYSPTVSVSIMVDSTSVIAEMSEANNTFSGILPMPTPPPACTFTPSQTYTSTNTHTYTSTETPTSTDTALIPTNTNTAVLPTNTNTAVIPTNTNTITIPTSTNTVPPATSTNTVNIPTNTPTDTQPAGVCLMDDCEDGDNTNKFGGYWYTYAAGNGVSIIPDTTANGGTYTMTAGGYGGSAYAINFTGTVGTESPDYPSIGVGGQLNPMAGAPPDGTGQVTDISGCTGVRFYTKGDGKNYHIKIPYTDVNDVSLTGYNDYRYDFAAPATWTQVDIPFTLFAQATGWGTAFPRTTVLQNAKALQFQTSFYAPAGTTTADLWIDNVELYGCTAACPTPPVTGPTDTATVTVPTATPTETASLINIGAVSVLPATSIDVAVVPTFTVNFEVISGTVTQLYISLNVSTITVQKILLNDTASVWGPGNHSVNLSTASLLGDVPSGSYFLVVMGMDGGASSDLAMTGSWYVNNPSASTNTPTNTLPPFTATNTWTNTAVVNTATNTPTAIPSVTNTVTRTFTHTFTNTPTNTSTHTFTHTFTNTYTFTPTNTFTNTPQDTPTFTPTHTPTAETLTIEKPMPWPNPYDPNTGLPVKIKCVVSQRDVDYLTIRIYTSANRLIKEKVYEEAALSQILNQGYVACPSEDFASLANGTYYYLFITKKDGKELRSKIDKIIILKGKKK